MVAVPLLFGRLTAEDYDDTIALDPIWGRRIDALRSIITCVEDRRFTADYHDPNKRSIANALTVQLTDGSFLPEVVVEYPIGHRLRRKDGIPLLLKKFENNLDRRFSPEIRQRILDASLNQAALEATPVDQYVTLYAI
jgi:2-methylcitrate dehydratase